MPTSNNFDPTRLFTLRRRFVNEMTRRFDTLAAAIRLLVIGENVFGITEPIGPNLFVRNTRWTFDTNPEKVRKFKAWLKEQVDSGILISPNPDKPWTGEYVESAYKTAVNRTYSETHDKLGASLGMTAKEFAAEAFNNKSSVKQIKALYERSYTGLKGITKYMDKKISETLAQGLADGDGARKVANTLVKDVGLAKNRALTLARTELTNAYAEGQLDGFEALGVEELGVLSEWLTAGDGRVCPLCASLNQSVYRIEDCRGLIPRHPNCLLPGHYVEGRVTAALKATYSGEAIEITTVNGSRFSVTANHPILTMNGVTLASKLSQNDKLLSYFMKPESLPKSIDINQTPTLIEQVFDSLGPNFVSESPLAFNFDTDEQFMIGKVDMVFADLKRANLPTKSLQDPSQSGLVLSSDSSMSSLSLEEPLFCRHGFPLKQLGLTSGSELNPVVNQDSSNSHALDSKPLTDTSRALAGLVVSDDSGVVETLPMPSSRCFGLGSEFDSILSQPSRHSVSLYSEFLTKFLQRYSGQVFADDVLHVRRFHYDGPVYDLETEVGYFGASDSISVSTLICNCRCSWIPNLDPKKMQDKRLAKTKKQIKESVGLERPGSSQAEANAKSKWIGADHPQSAPKRPQIVQAPAPTLYGEQPTAIIRWMQQDGWTFDEIKHVLEVRGVDVADGTIKTQISRAKKGQAGAELSLEQQNLLRGDKLKPKVIVTTTMAPTTTPAPIIWTTSPPTTSIPSTTTAAPLDPEKETREAAKALARAVTRKEVIKVENAGFIPGDREIPYQTSSGAFIPTNKGYSAKDYFVSPGARLTATQDIVVSKNVQYLIDNPNAGADDVADGVKLVYSRGTMYVHDGHHRVAASHFLEKVKPGQTFRAKVVDEDGTLARDMARGKFANLLTPAPPPTPGLPTQPPITTKPPTTIPPTTTRAPTTTPIPTTPKPPPVVIKPLVTVTMTTTPNPGLIRKPTYDDVSKTGLIRQLAKEGYDFKEAKAFLQEQGIEVADGTIKKQLGDGRRGVGVDVNLSNDQINYLRARKGLPPIKPGSVVPTTTLSPRISAVSAFIDKQLKADAKAETEKPAHITYSGEVTDLHREVWAVLKGKPMKDHNQARKIGQIVEDHLQKTKGGADPVKIAALEKSIQEKERKHIEHLRNLSNLKREIAASMDPDEKSLLRSKLLALETDPPPTTIWDRQDLRLEREKQPTKEDRLKVIKSLRDFGDKNGELSGTFYGDQDNVKLISKAIDHLPNDWVKDLAGTEKQYETKRVARGYHRDPSLSADGHLMISGTGGQQSASTTLHEMGHAIEYATIVNGRRGGRIVDLERAFKTDRIAKTKDPKKRVSTVIYKGTLEYGVEDDFAEHYAGKSYAGGVNGKHEILTLGLEEVVYESRGSLKNDADYRNFIVGLMVGF